MATLMVCLSPPFDRADSASALIALGAIYTIFVLSILSRLPEGLAKPPYSPVLLPLFRQLSKRTGMRIWILFAIVATTLLAVYAYLLQDLIPTDFFPAVLFVAVLPLVMHGVLDLDELIFPRKLTPQIETQANKRSLPRRLASPLVVIFLYSVLAVSLYSHGIRLNSFLSVIFVLTVLTFFLPFVIYGIHLLFVYIQSRRAPPFMWPPRKRLNGHKVGVWIPSLIATITLLYFPLACAVSVHLCHGPTETLPHYRIRIPWDWWVCDRESYDEEEHTISVLVGKGIAQVGFRPYRTGRWIRSFVTFNNYDQGFTERRLKQKAQEERKDVIPHDLRIGNVPVTCWEYGPPARWWETQEGPSEREVDCSTSQDGNVPYIFASFTGPQEDIPGFYKVVERIERTD
jgi:hypothetical protein